MQKYEADLPPVGAPDVTNRLFHLEVDGVDAVTELSKDATVAPFSVQDGKEFKVWVQDRDDAGNVSAFDPTKVYTATAVDDIPPAAPGAPGVRHVGEE